MSKTMRAVAAFQNGFAFYLIQKQADLVGSHLLMVEPAHELRDGSLEVDVVLPQRVVGIDEQSLGTGNEGRHRVCILTAKPYRRSAGDRRHRRHRASSPSSVVVPPISAMAAMMCDYGDLDAAICRSPITVICARSPDVGDDGDPAERDDPMLRSPDPELLLSS